MQKLVKLLMFVFLVHKVSVHKVFLKTSVVPFHTNTHETEFLKLL